MHKNRQRNRGYVSRDVCANTTSRCNKSSTTRSPEPNAQSGLARTTSDRDFAMLDRPLIRTEIDANGEKGRCMVATRDLDAGETVLVEMPMFHTPKPSKLYIRRLKAFTGHVANLSTIPEATLVATLVARWAPVLCAYALAPRETREAVRSLQTEFAKADSMTGNAVAEAARQLHRAGFYDGGDERYDGLHPGGVALNEQEIAAVISSMAINSADTLPDGSEALFYLGSLLEHSCAPNSKLVIFHSEQAPPHRGVAHLPKGTWVGEWRVLRKVRAGEAVTTSYLEDSLLAEDCAQRQRMLKMRMGFICRCCRCKADLEPEATTTEHSGEVSVSTDETDATLVAISLSAMD